MARESERSVESDATCGEVFYGWAPKGVWQLDFSVPRFCDLPVGHSGSHGWSGLPRVTSPAMCAHGEPEGNCPSCAACDACQGECGVCPYVTSPGEGVPSKDG